MPQAARAAVAFLVVVALAVGIDVTMPETAELSAVDRVESFVEEDELQESNSRENVGMSTTTYASASGGAFAFKDENATDATAAAVNASNSSYASAVPYTKQQHKDAGVLWEKTKPFKEQGPAQLKTLKRSNAKDRHIAVRVAQSVCTNAFSETKKQCTQVALSDSVASAQVAIKNAGDSISQAVHRALRFPVEDAQSLGESRTMAYVREVMRSHTSELGESSGRVLPDSVDAMAALGCAQLWKGIEALCEKGNVESVYGADSVNASMTKFGDDITTMAGDAATLSLRTDAPTPAPTGAPTKVFTDTAPDSVTYSSAASYSSAST